MTKYDKIKKSTPHPPHKKVVDAIELSKRYAKFGLIQQPQTVLNAMKELSPKQYEAYMKRERLLRTGKYATFKREVFVKNLLDVLEEKLQQYKDKKILDENDVNTYITNNDTIQTLIDEIKEIRFSDWDFLSKNFAIFLETYSEEMQEQVDMATLQDMLIEIRQFKEGDKYKPRKSVFRYTTISNKKG